MDSERRYRFSLGRGEDREAVAVGDVQDSLIPRMPGNASSFCFTQNPVTQSLGERSAGQPQKTEERVQVAAGLAHDFNNLLGIILGHCELLEKQPSLSLQAKEIIAQIQSAGVSG